MRKESLIITFRVYVFNIHDQGQLASRHAKRHPPKLQPSAFNPSNLMVLSESDPSNLGQRSSWSRFAASSLYDGFEYLGCWMKGTLFHQSLSAYKTKWVRVKSSSQVDQCFEYMYLKTFWLQVTYMPINPYRNLMRHQPKENSGIRHPR